MVRAALAQGRPMMVMAMITAAKSHAMAIHRPPVKTHTMFKIALSGDILILPPASYRHYRRHGKVCSTAPNAHARVEREQENVSMPGSAKATVLIDNDRFIVTEYRFAPGANTGWHRHAHDYVVVPLMDGRLKLATAQGESFADMQAGKPYFRKEGVEHDVINATEGEYAFIEVELK